jgi:hypothetical protein
MYNKGEVDILAEDEPETGWKEQRIPLYFV